MTIEKLKRQHRYIAANSKFGNFIHDHTKLSIQFAIDVLEELHSKAPVFMIGDKIQELKQHLDEKV